MIGGVAAAPAGERADDWISLVAPEANEAVKAQLRAFRAGWRSPRPAAPATATERVAALRAELKRRDLTGFVIGRGDEHQGEYVPKRAERLGWISGFTGSAGVAIVLADRAAIFVDGRYTLQVREEVDTGLFEIRHLINEPPERWIESQLGKSGRLGFDPWLFTVDQAKRFGDAAVKASGELVAVDSNPLDAIWTDQPPAPIAPVLPQEMRFAGRSAEEKRRAIGASLEKEGLDAAVISAPDSLCWLLNIRGGDVPRTPFALGFGVLNKDGRVDLFMDPRKFAPATLAHLGNEVTVQPRESFAGALDALGQSKAKISLDANTAGVWIRDRLNAAGASVRVGDDPCALPKACKNTVEIEGTRTAHRRDGAALTRFLAWFATEAPKGGLDELGAAEKLAEFRRHNELFRDFSFDSISGAGPNGAVVHYKVSPKSSRPIERNSIYLIDSGAQYFDGTTDVTRALAVGTVTPEMKDRFTRVLKGHIALATVRFPKGTTGSSLDALARRPLWDVGLDYDHGTGHGVGSYLSVHEGPQRISKAPNAQPLLPGMIVSNEPGYYKTGAYGIRIENLVVVTPCEIAGAEREMLCFETLTLAPIDRNLVDASLLSAAELAWLDAYHARVRETVAPQVDAETASWLAEATRPIAA
ncbi:MAG TPA: aminopeptidase P family protein [Candidatus Cybelea sp.]|nr:aminopeptidase P family protein [Candidatus Cybelea sp.]